MSTHVPEVFWWPDPQHAAASRIAEFTRYVRDRRGVSIPDGDYAALHAWSVRDLAGFWLAVAEFVGVRFHQAPAAVLGVERMPGAEWFPGATLNYAEHVLSPGPGRGDGDGQWCSPGRTGSSARSPAPSRCGCRWTWAPANGSSGSPPPGG